MFLDNEVAFRLRGPTSRKGAWVRIDGCAIYRSEIGVRAEDTIANLRINRLGFGKDVKRQYHTPGCVFGPGYRNTGQFVARGIGKGLEKGV